jgi:nanoRNase/pAp phosphatase (c-di-AMP/oligoRNAs hydrolase)
MDNSLLTLIDSAASILIVLPTKPYFDQVAAGLSLYLSIHEKKDVSIFCPTPMMVGSNRLIGINKVSEELGKKNLTIRFVSYEAANIDKVGYDIENGEFKLTVTPKSGFISPQKEQITMNYSGTEADLAILVGGANETHFPIISTPDLANAKIVHIGTRGLDTKREILSFAKPAATTSELVAGLIKENGLAIDPDVATNLVMGIEDGSEHFGSSEVTPETFETFAYLLRNGGQRIPKVKLSPINFPPGAIPTKPYMEKVSQVPQVEDVQQVTQPVSNPEPVAEQIENKETMVENPPDDWLQPKIFKGTNVS